MAEAGPVLGVIGGSGLYDVEGLSQVEEVEIATPFGAPSDRLVHGMLGQTDLWFLPRHGRGHRLSPTDIPFRANIWALKSVGVQQILAISAVGSMREEIHPGDMVVVDQFFDRTRRGPTSFFGTGCVVHVLFADPVCTRLQQLVVAAAREAGAVTHDGGTYLCMEGPAFSTRAESRIYRSWGVDVIGMTNLPEAKLAREAEICFATLALATDYDCWHATEADVTVDAVLQILKQNAAMARKIIRQLALSLTPDRPCACPNCLAGAILTHPSAIDPMMRSKLDLLIGRHLHPAA